MRAAQRRRANRQHALSRAAAIVAVAVTEALQRTDLGSTRHQLRVLVSRTHRPAAEVDDCAALELVEGVADLRACTSSARPSQPVLAVLSHWCLAQQVAVLA